MYARTLAMSEEGKPPAAKRPPVLRPNYAENRGGLAELEKGLPQTTA
jgi:hypothetical protein